MPRAVVGGFVPPGVDGATWAEREAEAMALAASTQPDIGATPGARFELHKLARWACAEFEWARILDAIADRADVLRRNRAGWADPSIGVFREAAQRLQDLKLGRETPDDGQEAPPAPNFARRHAAGGAPGLTWSGPAQTPAPRGSWRAEVETDRERAARQEAEDRELLAACFDPLPEGERKRLERQARATLGGGNFVTPEAIRGALATLLRERTATAGADAPTAAVPA